MKKVGSEITNKDQQQCYIVLYVLIWVAGSGSAFKLRIRIKNFHVFSWMFSFEGWRLLL
jgi:hypothetical protein